jgi:hypothetical protein
MYECLTGVVPFPKESEAAVLYAHMADPPPRVSDHRPDLPGQLDEVMASAMAKDPAVRPASAGALMLEVNRAFSRRMRAAFTPPGPIEVPEETGIRPAEMQVGTRESEQPTPDEVFPVEPPAEPTRAAAPAPPPPETAAPRPETAPPPAETTPGAPGQSTPGESAPGAPDETLPSPGAIAPGETAPAVGRGQPAAGAPAPVTPGPPPSPVAPAPAAPGPARPAAPPRRRPPARQGASPAVLVGGALLVVALAVIGFLVGHSGSGDEPSADTQRVAAGPLVVGPPSSWRLAGTAFALPGLRLEDKTALAPGGSAANGVFAVGMTNTKGATLLPPALLKRLDKAPPRNDPVGLGDVDAYRYADLQVRGFDRRLTMYVAPTTEGVATLVCAAPEAAAAGFMPDCESAATTLELASGDAYPLGTDPDYSDKLNATIKKLNAARTRNTSALRKANKAAGQAAAAQKLAAAYRSAARTLAGTDVNPELAVKNARVVRALGEVAAAYQQLAAAARKLNEGGYRAATKRVRSAEGDLRRALASVGRG